MSDQTDAISRCLTKLHDADQEVRGELLSYAYERLTRLAKRIKRDYARVGRWEQTDDVVQNAAMRLFQALEQVEIKDTRHFYRLAALQIRRELIDLCRHHQGPNAFGGNHQTQARRPSSGDSSFANHREQGEVTDDPSRLQHWGDFHECIESMPESEREVFELLWYHELRQEQVAQLVGLSTRQVKRLWRSAKLHLIEKLGSDIPR